jgi:hypothetical protein
MFHFRLCILVDQESCSFTGNTTVLLQIEDHIKGQAEVTLLVSQVTSFRCSGVCTGDNAAGISFLLHHDYVYTCNATCSFSCNHTGTHKKK